MAMVSGARAAALDGFAEAEEISHQPAACGLLQLSSISVQEIEARRARHEASDAAVEMDQVQHPAAPSGIAGAAEIFQIEKIEPRHAAEFGDHDVGLLQIAGVDAGVVQAAQLARERVGHRLAPRISAPRTP